VSAVEQKSAEAVVTKGVKWSKGDRGDRAGVVSARFDCANTGKNSRKIHRVSIPFLIAFEWNGKVLKRLGVAGFKACFAKIWRKRRENIREKSKAPDATRLPI
jgi:hypothetical protein